MALSDVHFTLSESSTSPFKYGHSKVRMSNRHEFQNQINREHHSLNLLQPGKPDLRVIFPVEFLITIIPCPETFVRGAFSPTRLPGRVNEDIAGEIRFDLARAWIDCLHPNARVEGFHFAAAQLFPRQLLMIWFAV